MSRQDTARAEHLARELFTARRAISDMRREIQTLKMVNLELRRMKAVPALKIVGEADAVGK